MGLFMINSIPVYIGLHMYNTYGLPAGQYVEVHA